MKNIKMIIGLLAVLAMASCSTEVQLANSFVAQSKNARVAVYFPEEAQVSLVPGEDGTTTTVLDSVDQNIFLDVMYEAYASALRDYGLDVYVPENPNQIQVDSSDWLVVLSKVEIQGRITDYVDRLFYFSDEYDYSFTLNAVNVASWYDFNDGTWHPTQFDEYNLRDDFSSHVTRDRKNGTQYHYQITPLKAADVYDFAVYLGKRQASFTYDYFMNSRIKSEMGAKNQQPRYQLRWDPYEGTYYFQLDDEGFIELPTDN